MFTQVDGVVRVPNRKGDLDVFFCSLDPSTGVLNVRKVHVKELLLVIQGEEHVCSLVPRLLPCRKMGLHVCTTGCFPFHLL